MNIQKAKILLEKVNALLKSVSMDEDNISNIEKDLMLSYIRQMYDAVLDPHAEVTIPTNVKKKTAPPKVEPPIFEINREESAPVKEPVRKTVEPEYTPPRIIEIPDSLKEMSTPAPKPIKKSKPVPKPIIDRTPAPKPPTPKPEPVPVPPQVKVTPPPVPTPKPTPVAAPVDKKVNETLFEFKAARELSEKLSERPIKDLTKAFALNDKLLYANELFGRELVVFNEVTRKLNTLSDFNTAKVYLAQLAEKFKWTEPNKVSIAKDFVKLVRRRFIK